MAVRIEVLAAQIKRHRPDTLVLSEYFLTISGGGADGAFSAGLLKGWTESGDRPEFLIVAGISTGALIAPFAFVGSDYDDELEHLYTAISTTDIIDRRNVVAALTKDALMDSSPLANLLETHIDAELIDRIAELHSQGRRLLIGTTNLDAQRPVVWNIGAIAQNNTTANRQLIRKIMLASASVPGIFPPVRFQVTAGDGEVYDELHVDGGATSQVFLYPIGLRISDAARQVGMAETTSMYVLRNGFLEARYKEVEPKLAPVLVTSLTTLIRSQGIGDLYRLYLGAQRDHLDFNLAYIPAEFAFEASEPFDPEYMKALFDFAYELARKGYKWHKTPPGLPVP